MLFIYIIILTHYISKIHCNRTCESPKNHEEDYDEYYNNLVGIQPNEEMASYSNESTPFFMIAHRVLSINEVEYAVNDLANAIEIDVCSSQNEWYADHDCYNVDVIDPYSSFLSKLFNSNRNALLTQSRGDKMEDMLMKIKQYDKQIRFIWFDIKNLDKCEYESTCGIGGLKNMTERILNGTEIKILWGLYKLNPAATLIARRLIANLSERDAIAYSSNNYEIALAFFEAYNVTNKVYDNGLFSIRTNLGNCRNVGSTCRDLMYAHYQKTQAKINLVFSWTYKFWYAMTHRTLNTLLDTCSIDGLIYGQEHRSYNNNGENSRTAKNIIEAIKVRSNKYHLATIQDNLW